MSDGGRRPAVEVWDRSWRRQEHPPENYHAPLVETLARYANGIAGKAILEIGAGTARDSLRLAELGAHAIALDYSPAALAVARQGMTQRGVTIDLLLADALRLPFATGSFDVVFSQGVVEHFSDPTPLIAEQIRVLKPGGVLLVDVPQTVSLYTLRKKALMRAGRWFADWETSYTLSGLERLLEQHGLTIVGSYGSGYYPAPLLLLRNLHTFDRRHTLPVRFPDQIGASTERFWTWCERRRSYYRWMWNVGVVGRKS